MRNIKISKLGEGKYYCFGLEGAIKAILCECSAENKEIKKLNLTFNVDGLPIFRSDIESL